MSPLAATCRHKTRKFTYILHTLVPRLGLCLLVRVLSLAGDMMTTFPGNLLPS
jgi:hypothetical protein